MADTTRPKRVVIVDADNPLQEIHGEFFWREDHERAVAAEREQAFREGYETGHRDASAIALTTVVRRRRPRMVHVVAWLVILAVVLSFIATLVSSMAR